jgi:DNA-binding GntR family transcriptional regulator
MHWTSGGVSAGDRVYHAIKARVIAYEFPQGERIYLDPLAADLGVSTTPVREAMNRLAAKDLVIKAPRKGFFALTLSPENLAGNYELTRLLLTHELEGLDEALRRRLPQYEPIAAILNKLKRPQKPGIEALTRYTAETFLAIGAMRKHPHVIEPIGNANDHLYYIRTLECRHFGNVINELGNLCELVLADRCKELVAEIGAYYEKRLSLLPRLIEFATR